MNFNGVDIKGMYITLEDGSELCINPSMIRIDDDKNLIINPYNEITFIDGDEFLNKVCDIADGTYSFAQAYEYAYDYYNKEYGRWEKGIPSLENLAETNKWANEIAEEENAEFYYDLEVYSFFDVNVPKQEALDDSEAESEDAAFSPK